MHDGEISCDTVVLAMGPWSTDAEAWLGVKVPVEPLRGEILRTELPGQEPLAHDLSGPGVSLHSRRGLVWIGTTEESRGFDVEPSEATRRSLMESAAKLMPAMAEARLVKHTVCLRPRHARLAARPRRGARLEQRLPGHRRGQKGNPHQYGDG